MHICNGTPGKARRVLLSLGTAPMDDDGLVRQLDAKHGKRRRAMRAARRVGNARIKIRLTEKYRKLRRGAGVGPDGFRNEYLRCPDGHRRQERHGAAEPHHPATLGATPPALRAQIRLQERVQHLGPRGGVRRHQTTFGNQEPGGGVLGVPRGNHLQGVLDQHHAEGGAQFAIGKVTTASGQTAYGIQVAGVPLGDDDYIREHISNKVAKVREGINKTKTALQDVNHQALIAMLAQCFVPTMVYEARIIPPTKMEAHLRELDDVIARTADACIGRQVKLTGRNARRRALPRKLKGGGIRSLGHLAPAAYVGCLCDIQRAASSPPR